MYYYLVAEYIISSTINGQCKTILMLTFYAYLTHFSLFFSELCCYFKLSSLLEVIYIVAHGYAPRGLYGLLRGWESRPSCSIEVLKKKSFNFFLLGDQFFYANWSPKIVKNLPRTCKGGPYCFSG